LGELQNKMAVAAQNINNSTLRSILHSEKLSGSNFTNSKLKNYFRSENKLVHLEQLLPLFLFFASKLRDKYYESITIKQEVACLMLSSMSPNLQRTLEKFNAYDMLKELKTMFEEKAKQELFEMVKVFHACKQEDGQSVSSYLLEMKSYLDTLERLRFAMLNELGVSLILNSLNKDYDQFIQNYNMHSMGNMIVELHAMLKLHEKGRIQKDKKKPLRAKGKEKGNNKLAYAPKPNIPSPPKRDNPTKDSICHHCKEVGHWGRNCPSNHVVLKKRKNASGASTSGIFTIELYAFPNKS
ncbi:zinc finger, CCHC-type containing protein, partial [Tanacetum coccineum]